MIWRREIFDFAFDIFIESTLLLRFTKFTEIERGEFEPCSS